MKQLNCAESFKQLFSYSRKILRFIGVDILDKNFNFNWRTAVLLVVINYAFSLIFYTTYMETIVEGKYFYLFKTGAILGSGLQGYFKTIIALKKGKEARYLYSEIEEIYVIYEAKGLSYKTILRYNIYLAKKVLLTTFVMVTITVLLWVLVSIAVMIASNTRIEMMPYRIPFVDTETDHGFYFTTLTQIVIITLTCYGNFVCDSWLFMFVSQVPLIKDILKSKINELNEMLENGPTDAKKTTVLLVDIFKFHQKYGEFTSCLSDSFFWIIFVQISTEFFGIACTVVCMFLDIWPPAPAFALYLYSLIFAYCALGNLYDLANEEITDMIYDCRWYNLTVPEQKMILIMLRESQRATSLSIGGVAPLSLNTALQLTKTIYTFSMMLKESFD